MSEAAAKIVLLELLDLDLGASMVMQKHTQKLQPFTT